MITPIVFLGVLGLVVNFLKHFFEVGFMGHILTEKDINVLKLLGKSLMAIRWIADRGHLSITDQEKIKLINAIAEAGHNLPEIIATGGEKSDLSFLLDGNVADLKAAIKNVGQPF